MKGYTTRRYAGIPVGLLIRRQIAKTWIYRIRRGRGIYGEKLGETIQDRYSYFVPGSINNPESEPYRRQWIAAVAAWQDLTPETKKWWNEEAQRLRLVMSGYNLFIRKAMKGEIGMFVDRGDPGAYDFIVGNFTKDGAWHTKDLSGIVPAGAKAVTMQLRIKTPQIDRAASFRQLGNTNPFNAARGNTQVANQTLIMDILVAVDVDRKIEYNFSNVTWTLIYLTVKGWWT